MPAYKMSRPARKNGSGSIAGWTKRAQRACPRSLVETLARIRMGLDPMAGDVPVAGDPDIVVLHHVIEQPFEAGRASRMAGQAHVQADRHHFRMGRPLAVEDVEGIAHEGEPVVARADRAGVFAGV